MNERKAIYEGLHPETKQGGTPGKKSGKGGKESEGKNDKMSSLPFTADTAQKLKKTMRSVQRDLAIAKGINHAVQEVIAGTPIADSVSPPAAVTVGQRAVEKHAFANSDGKTSDLNMGQLNQPRWPSG